MLDVPGNSLAVSRLWIGASLWLTSPSFAQETCVEKEGATLYGTVRSETNVPLSDVTVFVNWESGQREVSSSADGSYRVCSVPVATLLNVTAAGNAGFSEPILLEVPSPERFELDLSVAVFGVGATVSAGRILGTAVDATTGTPIAGARVHLRDGGVETLTGADGTFRLLRVAEGERTVVVSHIGYGTQEGVVVVAAGTSAVVQLRVSAQPIAVAPLEVIVEANRVHALEVRGFYERQHWAEATGRGYFFTEDQIKRRAPRLISQMIADVPGAKLDCARELGSRNCTLHFGGALSFDGTCERANVYLDGVHVLRSDNQTVGDVLPLTLDQMIAPQDIAAMEVYPTSASLPAEFGGSTGQCGAIAIWSK